PTKRDNPPHPHLRRQRPYIAYCFCGSQQAQAEYRPSLLMFKSPADTKTGAISLNHALLEHTRRAAGHHGRPGPRRRGSSPARAPPRLSPLAGDDSPSGGPARARCALGYEPYDLCLCRLASSLVAALPSVDGRRTFVSGPLLLPRLKSSPPRLACTNPVAKSL